MIDTRIISCLLLHENGLVKTERFRNPRYVGDPINAVRIFNEKECHELVFLDIDATRRGYRPRFDVIERIAGECFMPLAYGGGVRDLEDLRTILSLGVEKVVLNTVAFEDPEFVRRAADAFGSSTVVVSVDVKRRLWGKAEVVTKGGAGRTGMDPVSYARRMETLGAGEIILGAVDRDGTRRGYDLPLIRDVASSLSVPLVVLGGAGSLEDLRDAVQAGASAAAAGSLFVFYGKHRAVLIQFPQDEQLLEAGLT